MQKVITLLFATLLITSTQALTVECHIQEPCKASESLGYCLQETATSLYGKLYLRVGEITTLTELSPVAPTLSFSEVPFGLVDKQFGYVHLKRHSNNPDAFTGYILVPYDVPGHEYNELFNVTCER